MDRIPPSNNDFEQALLGSLLLSSKPQLCEFISKYPDGEKLFFDLSNAEIFRAILDLSNARKPVSAINIIAQLEKKGSITPEKRLYVSSLEDASPSGENASYYAEELLGLHYARQVIQACSRASQVAYNRDPKALDLAEQEIMNIRRQNASEANEMTIKDLASSVIDQIDEALSSKGKLRGIPTGIPSLDKKLRGLKPGQVFVIGARPSCGKTALIMNIAEHVAVDLGFSVGIFSLEMTKEELFKRLLCSRAEISADELENGNVNQDEERRITNAISKIANSPIHIQDPSGITIHILMARARWMAYKHQIKVLIIDYLQLLQGTRTQNRTQEMTEVSNAIKRLAKELGIPIIVAAQLNRETERESREPRLSDLRDSGSIEQDADICALLHPKNADENSNVETMLMLKKHRNGPTGSIPLLFRRSITKFIES